MGLIPATAAAPSPVTFTLFRPSRGLFLDQLLCQEMSAKQKDFEKVMLLPAALERMIPAPHLWLHEQGTASNLQTRWVAQIVPQLAFREIKTIFNMAVEHHLTAVPLAEIC